MLHADLEKCKVTQRLPQARSFCILGKKLLDKEESMRVTEEGKKSGEGNLLPQNRITGKLMNLAMSNQNVSKSRAVLHT